MYIFKNAIRNVQRSLGKNVLIGIIVFIISLSSCLALSIKEAAKTEKEEGMENLTISANISYDRKAQMENMERPPMDEGFDKEDLKENMKEFFQFSSLSLEELKTYAEANSVKDFYYTESVSINGKDGFEPIESEMPTMGGGMNGRNPMMGNSADFSLVAYNAYEAMSDFTSGAKSIEEGNLFTLEEEMECVISDELALYNSLEVGDSITLANPYNEDEVFTFTICGIYTNVSSTANFNFQMSDPANEIYTNISSVDAMVAQSEANSENEEESTYLSASVNGTYTFASVEDYEAFSEEVYELGLDESYSVSSSDITSYEQSLMPLENLSNFANIFLWIILGVGGIILVVFNMFRLKERKYEIGVLAAIGMNKTKVALQFVLEIGIVTFLSILLGLGIGCVSSVPVTNALLSSTSTVNVMEGQMPQQGGAMVQGNMPPNMQMDEGMMDSFSGFMQGGMEFIAEVDSAANLTVVVELLGIGLLLTIVSSGISVLTILRYEPLQILSGRD